MSDDKTEQPTPKRLREAREKGQIAKSQEISPALAVMGIAIYCIAMWESLLADIRQMTELPMLVMNLPYEQAFPMVVQGVLSAALFIVLPVVAVVMAITTLGNLAQVGVLFSFKAAMPKLENLSPKKWIDKVFSVKNIIELGKNILKVVIVGITVWIVLKDHLRALFLVPNGGLQALWDVLGSVFRDLLLYVGAVFCLVAGLDYFYQKWHHTKQLMMSKEEVKREYKEMEGDPQIKGQRRQLHKELVMHNTAENTRKATVLVTNPTHYAVALEYEKDRTPLPKILAKGEGVLAQHMIRIAKEENIPIMRNVPLAQSLYRDGTENAYIPQDLIGPVAEVLKWVQSLR